MATQETGQRIVILDACCVLNLYATDRMAEILEHFPFEFAVARYVAEEEVLYVARADATEESNEPEAVNLAPLVDSGHLSVLDLQDEGEMALAVRFGAELDDGEAITCAIAVARDGAVATDDRKALRLLAASDPPTPTYRTTELLSQWAKVAGISQQELKSTLKAVTERACYVPAKQDPLRSWWLEIVEGS